jgi:hypothetical protein
MTELERCRPWIEAALEYSGGTHTFDDVVDGVTSGRMQLWPAPRGCATTEIVLYPRKKVLHVFLAGGDMDQILDMIDSAAAWGRTQDCTALTLAGRLGWQRVLDKHGFTPVLVTMERNI